MLIPRQPQESRVTIVGVHNHLTLDLVSGKCLVEGDKSIDVGSTYANGDSANSGTALQGYSLEEEDEDEDDDSSSDDQSKKYQSSGGGGGGTSMMMMARTAEIPEKASENLDRDALLLAAIKGV